jgi:hypothetical protein
VPTGVADGDTSYFNGSAWTIISGNTAATNKFWTQLGDGIASASPLWQVIGASDVPSLAASKITSGTLAVARGGTNLGSYTTGQVLYASGSTTIAGLSDVATGNVLLSGGVSTAPSYGKVPLTTHVSGSLPAANGGIVTDSHMALVYYSDGTNTTYDTGTLVCTAAGRTCVKTFSLAGVTDTCAHDWGSGAEFEAVCR